MNISYFYSTMITEVQITCIVLMGLITLFLVFSLPRNTTAGKVLDSARKLLAGGTFLVMIHFIFQYTLHKAENDIEDIRTMANMLFGIPISYLVDMSYLYLLRKGKLQKLEWGYGPATFLFSLLLFILALLGKDSHLTLPFANQIAAIVYATVLIYYCLLQLLEYFRIRHAIRTNQDHSQKALLKWTKYSMFTLIIIGLGFPFMTFNSNLLMRSFYGILSISSAFFYTLCFIGYSLNYTTKTNLSPICEEENEAKKKKEQMDDRRMEVMGSVADDFIKSEYYLQAGITIKDAAVHMGISCNMLKVWLHSTKYEKFNNWITHLRIEKSKELLLNSPYLNSEEIAEQCGFCDRQYFQQLFKKQEGISPYKWLKERQFPDIHSERKE